MDDPFNLRRFVEAQADMFSQVEAELRAGRKRSHWMWWVFPQLAGLGASPMSQFFAIGSLEEARLISPIPCWGRACALARTGCAPSRAGALAKFSGRRTTPNSAPP